MEYQNVYSAIFLRRPNRFIAHCLLLGNEVIAHVPNTGRCGELLLPGCTVYLQYHDTLSRKTQYTLIAVDSHGDCINIDSQAPNKLIFEHLVAGKPLGNILHPVTQLQREKTFGNSRFDLRFKYDHKNCFAEIKGVTLRHDKQALFPDAPTQRGVKHIYELIQAQKQGFSAYIIFVIQMSPIESFSPNWETHAAFGQALREAQAAGVELLAYTCTVSPTQLLVDSPVPIFL